MTPPPQETTDVLIVGGGIAGLSAALALGLARRSVVIVDAGDNRNGPAVHTHGYLTRDGVAPSQLLTDGRAEVERYHGHFVKGEVANIERIESGALRATLTDGTYRTARRVLITAGLVDEYPDLPGLRERWGKDVVHCPFCLGWEIQNRRLAVLGTSSMSASQALMWRQWSDNLMFLQHTAPDLTPEQMEQLSARGIQVVTGEVLKVEILGGHIVGVRLRSGEIIGVDAVVVGPRLQARETLLHELGIEMMEHPMGIGAQAQSGPSGATSVPGVWVAGNTADVTAGLLQAAAGGASAAFAINNDLTVDDTALAVVAMNWQSKS